MKRGVALLLLALAACNRAPSPGNTGETAPPPGDSFNSTPAPSNMTGATAAPPPSTPMQMPMGANDVMMQPDQAQGNGPRERFIVCPGNPRCPPVGTTPGNRPN